MPIPVKSCPNCGYCLAGLSDEQCPECGVNVKEHLDSLCDRSGSSWYLRAATAGLVLAQFATLSIIPLIGGHGFAFSGTLFYFAFDTFSPLGTELLGIRFALVIAGLAIIISLLSRNLWARLSSLGLSSLAFVFVWHYFCFTIGDPLYRSTTLAMSIPYGIVFLLTVGLVVTELGRFWRTQRRIRRAVGKR